MSSSSTQARKSHNTALARRKALGTRVYISDLLGVHTLETGLAYYYRGHYIYAFPAGNLIEPIPYSTRRGVMIQGVLDEGAPTYDGSAEGLRCEGEVRALEASMEAEVRVREGAKGEVTGDLLGASRAGSEDVNLRGASGGEALKTCSRAVSPTLWLTPPAEDLLSSLPGLSALRDGALKAFTPCHGASFLAASAPGSRLASRSASPSPLRSTSSHVGLAHLGAIKGHDYHFDSLGSDANPTTEDFPSRTSPTVGYLHGLGDHALSAGNLACPNAAARVKPCAIHGEECDGVSVERACLTEETKKGVGFVEEVPLLEARGRQMVNWEVLLEEARAEEAV
ncbi:hypothetical protein E8E12_009900 [Didymella heteroderae]|uniref:Uncharacterized protein n=1 Tax=Didymella heteroderae TaxID=1769908 RepID=A0A9P4WUR0_9PLEO|nr:hypothetical protein E8E12_009900 [Didymella heteroderae]